MKKFLLIIALLFTNEAYVSTTFDEDVKKKNDVLKLIKSKN